MTQIWYCDARVVLLIVVEHLYFSAKFPRSALYL